MPIIVREGQDSRKFRVDNKGATCQWRGCAYGSVSQDLIFDAVLASPQLPATLSGLTRRSINGDHRGGGFWDVTVDFEVTEGVPIDGRGGASGNPDPTESPEPTEHLGSEFNFDAGGGVVHITQSLSTQGSKGLPGKLTPDTRNAIGLTRDGKVEGCDRYASKLEFSYAVRMAFITLDFMLSLRDLADAPVNKFPFLQFERGELLFMNAVGQYRGVDDSETGTEDDSMPWTVTYKFAVAKNQVQVKVSNEITLTLADRFISADADLDDIPDDDKPALVQWAKLGWEYLQVGYQEVVDPVVKISLPRPCYAKIEKIYDLTDFADVLGFGEVPLT